jgi:hypothetical protein
MDWPSSSLTARSSVGTDAYVGGHGRTKFTRGIAVARRQARGECAADQCLWASVVMVDSVGSYLVMEGWPLWCEVDVEMPSVERFGEIARWWFDEGFTRLAKEYRRSLETGPKLPPEAIRRAIPCGPPNATWGFVSIRRRIPGKASEYSSGRVWSPRSWKSILRWRRL